MYENLIIRIQIFLSNIEFCPDLDTVISNTYLIESQVKFEYNLFLSDSDLNRA